jgi:hypothetical protein
MAAIGCGAKIELCEYADTQGKLEIGPFAAARTQQSRCLIGVRHAIVAAS